MQGLLLAVLLCLAWSALADRLPLPADTPAGYRAECASCHPAFPPALLAADDWRRMLARLDRHFGTDATVDAGGAREIAAFVARHAGDAERLGGAGEPPRITRTSRFVRQHRAVPKRLWRDPRVHSAANCGACHRGAADGRYSEHDLLIAELRG